MCAQGHSSDWRDAGLATRAIHAGQGPDPATGAVMTPVYQTSTFAQHGVGGHAGWDYARAGNPTRDALEVALASLEQDPADQGDASPRGVAFSSGLAACDAVLREHQVSQVPVLERTEPGFEGERITAVVGSLYERALLDRAFSVPGEDGKTVGDVMGPPMPTVDVRETVEAAMQVLTGDQPAVLVIDNSCDAGGGWC